MKEECVLEVVNWDKFNPRGNEKKKSHHHWFRIEDTLFTDPQFADFEITDFMVLLYVLSTTCQRQGEPWPLKPNFAAKQCRVNISEFRAGIDKLLELNVVRLTPVGRTTKSILSGIQDITIQDSTEQNRTGENKTRDLSEGRNSANFVPADRVVKLVPATVVTATEVDTSLSPTEPKRRPRSNPQAEKRFVGEYVQAYEARWKTRPPLDGKTLGEIRRLVRDFGVERASALMQAYLQLDDPRFVRECHPFNLLMLNLSRLSVALDRGLEKPDQHDSWDKFWAKIDKQGVGSDSRSLPSAVE